MIELQAIQTKVSKVRNSCVTPEHHLTFYRYSKLYRKRLAYENNTASKRLRKELLACILCGPVIVALITTTVLFAPQIDHLFEMLTRKILGL